MKFWDTSAILPLVLGEAETQRMIGIHQADKDIAVWWGTLVECHSGLERRYREGLPLSDYMTAKTQLGNLWKGFVTVVVPTPFIQQAAIALLTKHPLRAADALQLATWLEIANTSSVDFVTLDTRLASAAAQEGATVLP